MINKVDSNSSDDRNAEFMQASEKLIQRIEEAKSNGYIEPAELVGLSLSSDIKFTQEAEELIQRIEGAGTRNLLDLAKIAGLNPHTDFAGGDLRDVNLSGTDLSNFDLSHADLSHADLSHADLSYTDLSYADCSYANLSCTNLLNANLSNVNLSSAIVEKARFGWNSGFSETEQIDLACRGARWEEKVQEVLLIWEEFTDSDRNWIVTHGNNKFLTNGDILIHQGKPIDTIYVVLKGEIDVFAETVSGTGDKWIATILATEMVGEMSFVKNLSPSATLVVKENTLVWSIPRVKLLEKLAQDSDFGYRFHRAISAVLANRLMLTTLKLLNEETADNDAPFKASAKLAIGGMLELQEEGNFTPV